MPEGAHGGLQCGGFGGGGGREAGGEEPVELVLGEFAGEPAEEGEGGFGKADLAERDAEGELEEWAGVFEKSPLDFSPAACGVLGDDEQACLGIWRESLAAPDGAGGQLSLRIGGLVEMDEGGGRAERECGPLAPGVEEAALCGEDAVESGKQERRAGRGIGHENREEFQVEKSGTQQVLVKAESVKGGEPGAERGRVLVPVGT